jgi:hypothetical protein
MVSSTHNHEGPDVIGLWGQTPVQSGVDLAYVAMLVERVVGMVQQAAADLKPARASYGTAQDDALVGDSRLPIVKDGVLRVLRFRDATTKEDSTLGILVQWNCHPNLRRSPPPKPLPTCVGHIDRVRGFCSPPLV